MSKCGFNLETLDGNYRLQTLQTPFSKAGLSLEVRDSVDKKWPHPEQHVVQFPRLRAQVGYPVRAKTHQRAISKIGAGCQGERKAGEIA